MTSTRLLFAVISVAYLVVAIPLEERSLVANFWLTVRGLPAAGALADATGHY